MLNHFFLGRMNPLMQPYGPIPLGYAQQALLVVVKIDSAPGFGPMGSSLPVRTVLQLKLLIK